MGIAIGKISLLENGSATGAAKIWPGGRGHFSAEGTFAGATIALQHKLPNGSWVDAGPYTTLTANGAGNFDLPPSEIRVSITGGPPSGVYAAAYGIGI